MSACGEVGPQTRSRAGALAARVVAALLMLAVVLAGSIGSPRPAYASAEPPGVQVDLESLEPRIPAPDDTVTLRGTARNDTAEPIEGAQVVLWRHGSAMTTNDDLRAVVGQAPEAVSGSQMWTGQAYQRLTTPEEPTWEPGQTRAFEISAPLTAFGFPSASGAYLIGAQVVGRPGAQTLGTLGQARVLLPLAVTPATGTNTIVTSVLLSSRPSMTEPGVFVDDHLAGELGPEGRLTLLLDAAQRDDVSWLVDPGLLDELSSMAGGYTVQQATGDRPGTGQEAARTWLAGFDRLDRGRGYQVPFAIPDVSMLKRQDLDDVTQRAAAAARRVPGAENLPVVAYSAGGRIDPLALPLAEQAMPVAILASTADVRGALLEPRTTAPIVNFSPATTAGGPGPGPGASLVQVRQRMLAESFLTARTDPGASTVRVLTTGAAARADLESDSSWVSRRTLGDLLQQQPRAWPEEMTYTTRDQEAELAAPEVDTLRRVTAAYAAFIELLANPEATSQATDAAIARTASSWWRGDRPGFQRFAAPQTTTAGQLWSGDAVELTAQRSVLMSGQSGSFPMTVTNKLDQAVRVTLTFESFQPQRLSIPDMTDVVVPAEQSVTVNVQPHAVGNGPVRIWSQVLSPSGHPISKRVWLTVEATNFGRVGWIIVVASGIVLLATTTLRIRQVRRERREAAPVLTEQPPVHPTPPVVTIDPPNRGDER